MSEDDESHSHSSFAAEGASDEILNNMNVQSNLAEQHILLNSEYTSAQLLESLETFRRASIDENSRNISTESGRIHRRIGKYDNYLRRHTEKKFSINIIEHTHYIYAFKEQFASLSQEAINLLINREEQFNQSESIEENVYKGLETLFTYLSKLLFRWGIFDINNYGYRFKGRSMTVKVVDMRRINQKCLTAEIFWFTYAIKHKPFIDKIDKAVLCYAEILQLEIDKVIDFLRVNNLEDLNFDIAPKWRVFTKNDPRVINLFELLKGLELAYRYFEKNLIQEFLKVV